LIILLFFLNVTHDKNLSCNVFWKNLPFNMELWSTTMPHS
jgi:hypothetical protein